MTGTMLPSLASRVVYTVTQLRLSCYIDQDGTAHVPLTSLLLPCCLLSESRLNPHLLRQRACDTCAAHAGLRAATGSWAVP